MKRVFIGDVQGCFDELKDLLDALAFDPQQHEVWFAGDLINRGPMSLETLRWAKEHGNTVLGNHDLHLLGVAAGERTERPDDTLGEILRAPDRDELLNWLRNRPLIHQWEDLTLVHAGLNPTWTDPITTLAPIESEIQRGEIPWKHDDLAFVTRVRHCNADGQRAGDASDEFLPWDSFYEGNRRVVFGHWAARGLVQTEKIVGLDTGCVWGGKLSAWVAEDDRVVQVPARRTYCPIE